MDTLFINININNAILILWFIMEFNTFVLLLYLTKLIMKNKEVIIL